MKRFLIATPLVLLVVLVFLFWLIFFSARPPLTIDPKTLAGDGSLLDYCALPELDGSGKRADQIPKGNTPGCGYAHFPLPILAECTEPLVAGAVDLRGLWLAAETNDVNAKVDHLERVEQCGARTVITAAGLIHDKGPNSTGGSSSNDTEGGVLFTIGDKEFCPRTSADVRWNDGVLDFHVLGWGPVVVRRYLEGEQLVWEYADGSVTRMNRICKLPNAYKTPAPRGPRIALF
ncbi:MAG: hypothetical protein ACPHAN_06190 [Pseudomonadales bacterium]